MYVGVIALVLREMLDETQTGRAHTPGLTYRIVLARYS